MKKMLPLSLAAVLFLEASAFAVPAPRLRVRTVSLAVPVSIRLAAPVLSARAPRVALPVPRPIAARVAPMPDQSKLGLESLEKFLAFVRKAKSSKKTPDEKEPQPGENVEDLDPLGNPKRDGGNGGPDDRSDDFGGEGGGGNEAP